MNKNPITYDHEAIQEYCRDNDWIYFGGGRHKTSFDKAKNCHFRYYKQISMDLLGYYMSLLKNILAMIDVSADM